MLSLPLILSSLLVCAQGLSLPPKSVFPLKRSPQGQGKGQGPPSPLNEIENMRKPITEMNTAAKNALLSTVQITYRIGRPVMTNAINVYHIYYGTWTPEQKALIKDYTVNIGASNWYKSNLKYYSQATSTSPKIYVKPTVVLANETTDNYSQAKTITNIFTIIKSKLDANVFPVDTNGIYFVLTSSDVTEGGMRSQYCGWHSYADYNGARLKYSFVGVPACSGCMAQTTSPNGMPGLESAISVHAHELVEAVSDPVLNAWYDKKGYENADKCAWTWGATSKAANGALYNTVIGTKQYLIQQNWDPALQKCVT